jgi:hypothetical protein
MTPTIHLAMKLRSDCRTPEAVGVVQPVAASLGMEPTATGRASLSFRVTAETFAQLSGTVAAVVPPRPPGPRDHGTPGGHTTETELTVPAALQPYVESIAVIPPATRMGMSQR